MTSTSHVLTVVGARPQFVKAAIVSRAIAEEPRLTETIVHTGQHYDAEMSQVFFDELGIPTVGSSLGIGSGSHGAQTGRMLEAMETEIIDQRPDWVMVYGDTNSTIAASLAAAKLHVPVAHVEAGLRSFNRRMPEEVNRVVTDHLSTLLFAPTSTAVDNLTNEGIVDGVHLSGDVMLDAALAFGRIESTALPTGVGDDGYILATLHRAENTDEPARLAAAIDGLADVSTELPVVLPVHPRTRPLLDAMTIPGSMRVVPPVGYLEMVGLERRAALIVTDSGGVQKEAYFHRVPCVTLRDETEWVELVEHGWNRLVPPTSAGEVARGIREALGTTGDDVDLYGGGKASEYIASTLCEPT